MRISTGNLVGACLGAALLAACGGGNNGLSSSTPLSVAPQVAAPLSKLPARLRRSECTCVPRTACSTVSKAARRTANTRLRASSTSRARSTARPRMAACTAPRQLRHGLHDHDVRQGNRAPPLQGRSETAHTRMRASSTSTARSTARRHGGRERLRNRLRDHNVRQGNRAPQLRRRLGRRRIPVGRPHQRQRHALRHHRSGGRGQHGTVFTITTSGKESVLYSFGSDRRETAQPRLRASSRQRHALRHDRGRGRRTTKERSSRSRHPATETVLHSFEVARGRRTPVGGPHQRQRHALRHDLRRGANCSCE